MAIVENDYYEVTLGFIDATGSKSSCSAYLPATLLIAAVRTRAAALATAIALATGCQLASRSITLGAVEVDPGAIGFPGSRVEQKVVLQFKTAKGKRTSLSIPAPIPGIITADGRAQEDAATLDAVVDELIAGGWCDTNGIDIVSLAQAYERFTSSTRAMLPSKRTPDADADAAT